MFEKKSEEEVDKMTLPEFEKYSNDLAQAGVIPDEPEAKSEEKPKKEETEEEEKAEEETKDQTEEGESEEETEEEDKKKDGKPSPAMSLEKYNKAKKKWEDKLAEKEMTLSQKEEALKVLTAQMEEINSKKDDLSDEDFNEYIEETGADPEAIKKLIKLVSKNAVLDTKTKERLEAFEASQLQTQEQLGYENDFNSNIAKLIKKDDPNISQENLDKAKSKLKELAYSDKYFKYDLKDVYTLNKSAFTFKSEKKKTFESSRPSGTDNNQAPDYSEVTPEDIDKMSLEEFDKYSEAMAKAQGNERFKISSN